MTNATSKADQSIKNKAASRKKIRQAVIIVHGMGEQKPMTTLRGFASSILDYEQKVALAQDDYELTRWVKPNIHSTSYNSKRITVGERPGYRPVTDFMEYYWAHNMRDNCLSHVWGWFLGLMFKLNVPRRLVKYWVASWLFLILFLVCSLFLAFPNTPEAIRDSVVLGFRSDKLLAFVLAALAGIIQYVLVGYLGDVARYLRMAPENVAEHDKILKEGMDLIESIEKASDRSSEYDRIIIVAHSLGSVIAYEMITQLWAKYYKEIEFSDPQLESDFEKACTHAMMLGDKLNEDKKNRDDLKKKKVTKEEEEKLKDKVLSNDQRESMRIAFQKAQKDIWQLLRHADRPWIISDFITLGSPLNHGHFLLANSEDDFNKRIKDREFSTCPPVKENGHWYYNHGGKKKLHLGASFACIRWTNFYYPGDIVGGDIAPAFGEGVVDEKAKLVKKKSLTNTLIAHAYYWSNSLSKKSINDIKEKDTIKKIYNAMDLNSFTWGKKPVEDNLKV